jgi:hypothetical protein
MVYKLFLEDGKYQDKTTKERRNMMEVEIAYTPEGINVGWDEFNSIEEAMEAYNIELRPKLKDEEEWI